jgi:hypothetical protein
VISSVTDRCKSFEAVGDATMVRFEATVYSLVNNEISFFLEAFIASLFFTLKKFYYPNMLLSDMYRQSKLSSEFFSAMAFE